MFTNIYKKIKKDFDFLNDFSYFYHHDEHHNVMPSVVFSKDDKQIQIGMHYEDGKMFVIIYDDLAQVLGENLIENYTFQNRNYDKQVEEVKVILKKYLEE